MRTSGSERAYGLYLHTPFCATKCPYCDFYSGVFPRSRLGGYLDAVEREIEHAAAEPGLFGPGWVARSLFVGGGTPSELPPPALARLLGAIRARFALAPAAEITVECNPESFGPELAARLSDLGVGRLSLGVQSLDDQVLARLGRPHDAARALAAARLARARFPLLSLDVIFAVPGLARSSLAATLDRLLDLGPDHLSAYGLTIEPGTPFAALAARGALRAVDDEAYLAADALIEERAERAGLHRYEVSNYARPGAECRHHLAVWRGGFYLGFGPSAHSYLPGGAYGRRRANVADLDAYVARLERGESPLASSEVLDREQAMTESLLLGLRLSEGLDGSAFRRRFGIAIEDALGAELRAQLAAGLLALGGGRLRATAAGRAVLDGVLGRLAGGLAAA